MISNPAKTAIVIAPLSSKMPMSFSQVKMQIIIASQTETSLSEKRSLEAWPDSADKLIILVAP
jgi:hypothetical protein